jgi:hypothetical protein
MKTIEEQERQAYMAGDTDRAALLAQIFDLMERISTAERLIDEALDHVKDEDWREQAREFLE